MSRTVGIFTDSTERISESDICRLCRKNRYYFCNLFTSNVEYETSVKHALHDLVGLQVDEGDGLPTTICSLCLKKLKDFSIFKKICLESDTELRKISPRDNCGSIKGEGAAKDEPGSSSETKDCIRDASKDTSQIPCSVQVTEIYIPVPECEPPLDNMLFNVKAEYNDQRGGGNYPAMYPPDTAGNSDNTPDPLATDDLGDFGTYRSSHVKEDQISDDEGGCVHNDFPDGNSSKLANEASSDEPTFMEDGEPIEGITMALESTTEAVGFLAAKGMPIGATSSSYLSAEGNVMNRWIDECIDPTSLVRQIDPEVGASHFGIERNLMDEDLEICGALDTDKKTNSSIPDGRQCNTKYTQSLRSKGGGATMTVVGDRGRDGSNTTHNLRSVIFRGNDTSGCETVMGDNEEINNCLIKNPGNSCKSNEVSYHCFNCGDVFNNKNDLIKHMKIHFIGDYLDAEEKSSMGGDVSFKNPQSSGSSYSSFEPTTSETLNGLPIERLGLSEKGDGPLKETTGRKEDEKEMRRVTRSFTVEEKSTSKRLSSKSSCIKNLCNRVGVRRREESYSCSVCTLSFPQKKDLTEHKRIHMTETSYSCNECQKSFSRKSHLVRHISTHSGGTPYSCNECEKAFVNKSHLVTHLRTHTEKRPYICDVCSNSFSEKNSLVRHMRRHTGERPFSCRICKKSFTAMGTLRSHIKTHTADKPYSCNICKKSFTAKDTLRGHIRIHTGEKPFSCSICKKSFTAKGTLRGHMKTHTGGKPYSCNICKRPFSFKSNVRVHMRTHSAKKPIVCNVCSRSFTGIGHLNRHVCLGTGEMPYTCQICQKSFTCRSYLKIHMRKHTGERPYACRMCEKSFAEKGTLQIHIRTHTGERPYSCYHCEKSFSAKTDLIKHVRIHTGEKPYTCNVCGKSFSCSKGRVKHLRTHTGEKPYECSICQKSFAEKGALRMHMRTHTGEKPHSCSMCKRSFALSSNLKSHIRTHTGEKPFKCNVCSQAFAQGGYLKGHMRVHTGEKPYECSICKKSFTVKSSLSSHMRVHTGDKPYQCEICCKSFAKSDHLARHMGVHK